MYYSMIKKKRREWKTLVTSLTDCKFLNIVGEEYIHATSHVMTSRQNTLLWRPLLWRHDPINWDNAGRNLPLIIQKVMLSQAHNMKIYCTGIDFIKKQRYWRFDNFKKELLLIKV